MHAPVAIPMAKAEVVITPSPMQIAAARFAADVGCLADVMYYEARGEGVAGEKAVAEVVLQRTKDRRFPHTICGVVHDGAETGRRDCQFSFACNGSADKPKEPSTWRQVQALAEKIVSGTVKLANETGHAVAFHRADVTPGWADTMQMTAQIGNHVFYRRAPRVHAPAAADAASQPANAGPLEASIAVKVKAQAEDEDSGGI